MYAYYLFIILAYDVLASMRLYAYPVHSLELVCILRVCVVGLLRSSDNRYMMDVYTQIYNTI